MYLTTACQLCIIPNMNTKKWISAQMSEGLVARLSEVASEQNVTRSEILRRAAELYLAQTGLEKALAPDGHAAWLRETPQPIKQ